jgi:hypothetical protein
LTSRKPRPATKPRAGFSGRRRRLPNHVWWKWEALEYLASADAVEGKHIANLVIVALALVKADIIRFGIGKQGA